MVPLDKLIPVSVKFRKYTDFNVLKKVSHPLWMGDDIQIFKPGLIVNVNDAFLALCLITQ